MRGKLIIVEDQNIFRKGLRKLIEEEGWGWTVAGEASNGEEALELMELQRPDLVLTDIRMPVMDGLQLAERIQTRWPGTPVIILTAYKDFEYAQAALRYEVKEFLIKPCNEHTVGEVLRKEYDHFLKRASQREKELLVKRQAWTHDFRSLLLRLPLPATMSGVRVDVEGKQLWMIKVVQFFPKKRGYRLEDLDLLQFAFANIISEVMDNHGASGQLIPVEQDEYALLFMSDDHADHQLETELSNSLDKFLGIPVFVYRHGQIGKTSSLPQVYEEFKRHCPNDGHAAGDLSPVRYGEGPAALSNSEKVKQWKARLTLHIVLGRTGQLYDEAESFIGGLHALSIHDAKLEAFSFSLALQEIVRREFSVRDEQDPALNFEQVYHLQTILQMKDWLRKQFEWFMQAFMEWQEQKSDSHVQKVIQYIERHYMESCTLAEAAREFHLTEPHLSKIFKKETGETFVNYVTKVRMEKSKLLLANTDMKIFEIASAVGYDDPNYFAAVFKTTQQLSPRDYRKNNEA